MRGRICGDGAGINLLAEIRCSPKKRIQVTDELLPVKKAAAHHAKSIL